MNPHFCLTDSKHSINAGWWDGREGGRKEGKNMPPFGAVYGSGVVGKWYKNLHDKENITHKKGWCSLLTQLRKMGHWKRSRNVIEGGTFRELFNLQMSWVLGVETGLPLMYGDVLEPEIMLKSCWVLINSVWAQEASRSEGLLARSVAENTSCQLPGGADKGNDCILEINIF